jgi:hypothetical protein
MNLADRRRKAFYRELFKNVGRKLHREYCKHRLYLSQIKHECDTSPHCRLKKLLMLRRLDWRLLRMVAFFFRRAFVRLVQEVSWYTSLQLEGVRKFQQMGRFTSSLVSRLGLSNLLLLELWFSLNR